MKGNKDCEKKTKESWDCPYFISFSTRSHSSSLVLSRRSYAQNMASRNGSHFETSSLIRRGNTMVTPLYDVRAGSLCVLMRARVCFKRAAAASLHANSRRARKHTQDVSESRIIPSNPGIIRERRHLPRSPFISVTEVSSSSHAA